MTPLFLIATLTVATPPGQRCQCEPPVEHRHLHRVRSFPRWQDVFPAAYLPDEMLVEPAWQDKAWWERSLEEADAAPPRVRPPRDGNVPSDPRPWLGSRARTPSGPVRVAPEIYDEDEPSIDRLHHDADKLFRDLEREETRFRSSRRSE
jgi:hypothetical protein